MPNESTGPNRFVETPHFVTAQDVLFEKLQRIESLLERELIQREQLDDKHLKVTQNRFEIDCWTHVYCAALNCVGITCSEATECADNYIKALKERFTL